MMELSGLARLFPEMDLVEITTWIERGWVQPEPHGEDWVFQAVDVARVRLIRDLRHSMALDEEAVPVVLSLMDQVYEMRGQLHRLLRALETQPAEVRASVLRGIEPGRGG